MVELGRKKKSGNEYEASNDDLARTAEYAWDTPFATGAIRNHIVRAALARDGLFTGSGEGSKFEMAMLDYPELAAAIAQALKRGAVEETGALLGHFICINCDVVAASKLTRSTRGLWCCLDCGVERSFDWWKERKTMKR